MGSNYLLIPKSFARRVDWNLLGDPLRMQVVPVPDELEPIGVFDFSEERKFMKGRALIHKYPDRAVLLATNQCFGHCRFCFRKQLWNEPAWMISDSDIKIIVSYLLQHDEIKEVIVSGGDPLVLSDNHLEKLIKRLGRVPGLDLIRIASRALCFQPGRINLGLIRVLRNSKKQVWFISHFNHPAELGPETRVAAKKLIAAGIPVLSQAVLLKGINDRVEILLALFRELAGLGIKPYQLFQCDPAPGAAHFVTELSDSLKIVEKFGKVSGIILPRFALELPGYGKLSPGPGWKITRQTGSYRLVSPEGRSFRYPAAKK